MPDVLIEPFEIAVDAGVLTDLRERITRTRWPNHDDAGWQDGADVTYVRDLLATWVEKFDWRAREHELNRYGHHTHPSEA